jgi:16S rRNA (guanine(966)-N(2))-methyltransferase RsmD
MRIIGGKYSKRIIKPPRKLPVRPTTDLAKESLFNILHHKIEFSGKSALDLFTGTGSLAFEFSSRGCLPVTAVDLNFHCTKFVRQTALDFGMEQFIVIRSEVFRFLKTCGQKFDIIFADPPYDMSNIEELSSRIFSNQLLNENGWLIIEHPKEIDFSSHEYFTEHRRYGHVNFSLFKYRTIPIKKS